MASQSRHARTMTRDEWLADALSGARQIYHRACDSLAFDAGFGVDADALARQARADGLTVHDLAEAEVTAVEASRRSVHLDASAAHFQDAGSAATLHAAARQLQDAADRLRERAAAFKAPVEALNAEADDEDGEGIFVDATEEQVHVLETRRPVLLERRRVTGSGAPYLTLSDEDMQTVFEMVSSRAAMCRPSFDER